MLMTEFQTFCDFLRFAVLVFMGKGLAVVLNAH